MQTTPRFQRTINYAKESLVRLGHSHVSSAHLVLGLLELRVGVAARVLWNFGLSIESIESYLSSRRSPQGNGGYGDVPLSKSGLAACQRAEVEAQNRQHTYVGTEHLLLGILSEENGEAADVFASLHVDRKAIQQVITEELEPIHARR